MDSLFQPNCSKGLRRMFPAAVSRLFIRTFISQSRQGANLIPALATYLSIGLQPYQLGFKTAHKLVQATGKQMGNIWGVLDQSTRGGGKGDTKESELEECTARTGALHGKANMR